MEEIDNARHLVSLLLAADEPHFRTTAALRNFSVRSLGNSFDSLVAELMPSVISHRVGKAYDQHANLVRLFLLNLVAVGFSHERLSIQSAPKKGDKINEKFGLDQRKSKRIIDALIEHGLMEKKMGW